MIAWWGRIKDQYRKREEARAQRKMQAWGELCQLVYRIGKRLSDQEKTSMPVSPASVATGTPNTTATFYGAKKPKKKPVKKPTKKK